ncbi:MAG: VWA domain-containing protein [Actinobacteria bacterium]|nr:VWA domain-containing protein [Actinomycetota bacterium]
MTQPGADHAHLVGFGRELRARGLPVGTGRILDFCRAAGVLAPADRRSLYWSGRSTLISRPEDAEVFDSAFAAYFGRAEVDETKSTLFDWLGRTQAPAGEITVEGEEPGSLAGFAEAEEAEGGAAGRMVASAAEMLRDKSFDSLSEDERNHAALLIRHLKLSVPSRTARRQRPSVKARRFDLQRTLRSSLRTQGEPFRRAYKDRRQKVRPLVLVLDVSGSMSAYSRALMQFAFAAISAGQKVEVFCFGTRLTRVTRALRTRDPDAALQEVAATVQDWDGGTRIGESLRGLLDEYGQHVALRRAVVVLCSDGLDRGDPDVLAAQMARLGRLAWRVIWVNPLKGSPLYQPLARGMAAALPHVDVFLPGHNVASLEALGKVLVE